MPQLGQLRARFSVGLLAERSGSVSEVLPAVPVKIEVVAGRGWGRRARVRPLHALSRAVGMLSSQRSQSCNEEGAFFGARALRRPRGKGSGSPPC
ncbi:jg10594 [Pararge aegeria aegeria]|uniref:Jg10594 protein n=1 Tax=Pararge aegeria aegeria TaxID=348720 RepID=A0A8S4RYW1_9NEOP|nr:jg10594 [Pararge aegeria aegeria]